MTRDYPANAEPSTPTPVGAFAALSHAQAQGSTTPTHSPAYRRVASQAHLPAVKGTISGIETPRRDIWSPSGANFARSEPQTPAGSTTPSLLSVAHSAATVPSTATLPASGTTVVSGTTGDTTIGSTTVAGNEELPVPPSGPSIVFRADPRARTCFDMLPEGGEEVKQLFGVI